MEQISRSVFFFLLLEQSQVENLECAAEGEGNIERASDIGSSTFSKKQLLLPEASAFLLGFSSFKKTQKYRYTITWGVANEE